MCYLIVERYSVCRCLYYKHNIDVCPDYGRLGHLVQERTLLVGYACEKHSHYQKESLWSNGSESLNQSTLAGGVGDAHQGVKITSTAALRALHDAQLHEDDDVSTERYDESVMETASTRTSVDDDPRDDTKPQGASNHNALDDFCSRLRNPKQYIRSLQDLEERVWENSSISLYATLNSTTSALVFYTTSFGTHGYIPFPPIPSELQDVIPNRLSDDPFSKDPTNTSDEEITAICQSATDPASGLSLNAIRMCRNLMLKTFFNLKLLQQSNFCAGSFSVLILDQKRDNVAKLLTIESTDFIALVYEMEYILRDCASLVVNAIGSPTTLDLNHRYAFLNTPMVKKYCQSLLQMSPESSPVSGLGVMNVLRLLTLMLDLAVASYAGAHCSGLLDGLLNDYPIILLAPFADCSDELKSGSFRLQRRQLQCLDTFHCGQGVWVFCPPDRDAAQPLYLSTDIDTFSDIWGPLWKLKHPSKSDRYSAYVVGGGSIIRWQHDIDMHPVLVDEEFCHWITNEELEGNTHDKLDQKSHHLYTSFGGTEKLLIGAPTQAFSTSSSSPWATNPRCSVPISRARTQLRESGRLCIVGASKPYHYNDSNQYQLQVGYSGVNASATRQYKRVPGQTLKDILLELWALEPEVRDPRLLEDLHGVEISMCTSNAQRASLAHILRLKCMQNLLRDFSWGDPTYHTEHSLTLLDTLRPKRQNDPQFKEKFDNAVMLGLRMLSKTGVDKRNNLQVFLSSTCTPKPELVTMVPKEHSWIGLLKDTTTECAMAAFGDSCLEFKYQNGVSCGGPGNSALRSAMIPHSSYLRRGQLEKVQNSWMYGWASSILEDGKTFSLGERGKLRTKSNLGGSGLVMEWSSQAWKKAFGKIGGREQVHREYTEVDHSEDAGLALPVPIIVISDRPREVM